MAKLWYEPRASGAELQAWNDPQVLTRTSIEDSLAGLQTFRQIAPEARTLLALGGVPGAGIRGGWADLASFDSYLDDEIDRLADLLDVFDYDSRTESITVRDGANFSPSIESVSSEEIGFEGALAVDGDNASWWQTNTAPASIVVRVRDHRKMITGVRLRTTAGDLRAQLQGVAISVSGGVAAIDDPGNVIESGIDFTYAGDPWIEHTLASKKRGRYVKLDIGGSLHGSNAIRVRELEVRVGITNHEK